MFTFSIDTRIKSYVRPELQEACLKYKRHGKVISGQSLLESTTVFQNFFSGQALLMIENIRTNAIHDRNPNISLASSEGKSSALSSAP